MKMLKSVSSNHDVDLRAQLYVQVRSAAFKYLIDHLETRYKDYDSMDFKNIRFIPALNNSDPCLGSIQEVREVTIMNIRVTQTRIGLLTSMGCRRIPRYSTSFAAIFLEVEDQRTPQCSSIDGFASVKTSK